MRYVIAIAVVLVVLGSLAAIKASQIATLIAYADEAERAGPPPEAVGAATATEQIWERTLDAVGTIASSRDVAIRAEVPGVVTRVAVESGETARAGQVLVVLDASVERAELAGAIADARFARLAEQRARTLLDIGAVPAQELDRAVADRQAARARVAQLRATIAKKTIRAPFAGRVGIREVNVGELVQAGEAVTTLGSDDDRVFVDFALPQEDVTQLAEGLPVRVGLGAAGRPLEGTITALQPIVSASTRTIGVRAEIPRAPDVVRPGMFADVEVVLPERRTVVAVPATAIVHAPYGDSVFVVEDLPPDAPGPRATRDGRPIRVARQAFVRTGEARGDFVAILDGVRAGAEVVSAGAFKLRNGSTVYVVPEGAAIPELTPRPESR